MSQQNYCKNLHVQLANKEILKGVSLDFPHGKITAILGPNGAGKSTLLKSISGQISSQSGEIFLKGKILSHYPIHELAKQRAVMSQSLSVDFDFTVIDIVLMGRHPHNQNWASEKDNEIAMQCLKEVECQELAQRHFTSLSGGEQQRVNFARALAQIEGLDAPILFLDEVIANLDPEHQIQSLEIARKQADKGVAVFISIHDLNLASRYADQIYFIREGKITESGSPNEVFTEEKIKANFNIDTTIISHPQTGKELIVYL